VAFVQRLRRHAHGLLHPVRDRELQHSAADRELRAGAASDTGARIIPSPPDAAAADPAKTNGEPVTDPVIAQRALLGDALVLDHALLADPPVDDPERTGRHAVAAAVADVVLHHHRAELGTKQRPGRAHVRARGVGAVLADVGLHRPAELGSPAAFGQTRKRRRRHCRDRPARAPR